MEKQKFAFAAFQAEAIPRLRAGDAVLGREGILASLLKQLQEKALGKGYARIETGKRQKPVTG